MFCQYLGSDLRLPSDNKENICYNVGILIKETRMEDFSNFWNKLWSNVPDIIIAVLVLVAAFVVAAIARWLVVKVVKSIGLERGMIKAGTDKKSAEKTIRFIGKLVYLIVFLLFVPGIFEKLGLNNVATPLVSMMNILTQYLPNIVGALVVMVIGLFLAKIIKELLAPVLRRMKLNEWLAKIGVDTEKIKVVDILATTVYIIVVVLFAVEAISILKLEILTKMGNGIVEYLPFALSAVLVILIAFLLGSWVETTLVKKFSVSKFTAMVARVAIIITGGFMALSQLGVASTLVNGTYMIVVGALGVAFAIAFGIGGRDFAAHSMKKIEQKIDENNRTKR